MPPSAVDLKLKIYCKIFRTAVQGATFVDYIKKAV